MRQYWSLIDSEADAEQIAGSLWEVLAIAEAAIKTQMKTALTEGQKLPIHNVSKSCRLRSTKLTLAVMFLQD
jgi:hypothetical protein